jgi:hypothetical protein
MTVDEPLAFPLVTRRNVLAGAALLAVSAIVADVLAREAPAVAAPVWYHPFSTRRTIRSKFGPRASPCAGCSTYHRGLDYAPGRLTPVHAVAAGTVVWRRDVLAYGQFESNSLGNCVTVDHGNGTQSVYAHLERGTVAPLGRVEAGTVIGGVGHNGSSTGPHLHIEIRQNGVSVDPEPLIHLAPLAGTAPPPDPESTELERLDMLIIRTNAPFGAVETNYTALVGFKSLHHLTGAERDALVKYGKMTQLVMSPAEFQAILTAFQIPVEEAVYNANYDGHAVPTPEP